MRRKKEETREGWQGSFPVTAEDESGDLFELNLETDMFEVDPDNIATIESGLARQPAMVAGLQSYASRARRALDRKKRELAIIEAGLYSIARDACENKSPTEGAIKSKMLELYSDETEELSQEIQKMTEEIGIIEAFAKAAEAFGHNCRSLYRQET